jgi:UDP-N-acetylmuramyl-tripeptide synthetase
VSAVGPLAGKFYRNPAYEMFLVGITGTNGKTSSAFLLKSILEKSIGVTGIIGTVGYGSGENIFSTQRTTPGAVDLNRKLAAFRDEGCKAVVMEVSSHGVVQGRISGIEFDVGVFTNITRDHLDYHKTFESYLDAKRGFVSSLVEKGRKKDEGKLIYNMDDPVVRKVGEDFKGEKISFGIRNKADICARNLKMDLEKTSFELVIEDKSIDIELNLLGEFSVYNALSAAGASHVLDSGMNDIKAGLDKVESVPGRFQVIPGGNGPIVVVDYAHTPDALENVLGFCKNLGPRHLITVFGCGGDRDRGKRPIMGSIAARFSDSLFVTTDNPRTENPQRIIDEILEGIDMDECDVEVVADRRDAIRKAVMDAGKNDLVLIAGKGHEKVQIIGQESFEFNDVSEAASAIKLREVGYRN